LLVDSVESMMMHGLANPKQNLTLSCVFVEKQLLYIAKGWKVRKTIF